MNIRTYFCLIFLVSCGLFAAEYTVPRAAYSLYAEDLDLDGDKDIVVGHKVSWQNRHAGRKTISILENIGYGKFIIADTSKSFCGYQENIMAKKIDGDNYPDLITFMSDFSSGTADRYIRIFYSEQGLFNIFSDFTLNSSETFSDITSGDIDGDNAIDIIVASNRGSFWGILYNDGTGQFSSPTYYSISHPKDIKCGDLNDDNRDDIVICGPVQVFFSDTLGFISAVIDSFEDEIEIADMDNDGDNDMVGLFNIYLIGYTGITLYENKGNNDFKVHDEVLFQPSLSYFELVDVNNDSMPDVVCTGDDGIYILQNQGNHCLSDPQFFEVANYGEGLRKSICADLDGNGYEDIITIRYLHAELPANLHILFNDGTGNFIENPVAVIEDNPRSVPEDFQLYQNYPNPFNNSTAISYYIHKPSEVELSVYTINGQLVKTITSGQQKSGRHTVRWNGNNNNGKEVSSGVYVYTLRIATNTLSKKMIFAK